MKYFNQLLIIICSLIFPFAKLQAKEITLYSFHGSMEESHGGFLWLRSNSSERFFGFLDIEKALNTDMTQPIDFAGGKMHIYMRIINQPVPQNMRVGFNVFQPNPNTAHPNEIGTKRELISGIPGNTYTWVYQMSSYEGWNATTNFWIAYQKVDWALPRSPYTVRFWTPSDGQVHLGQGWAGEDPKKWFPLEFVYLVVVVEKGSEFSGWDNYIDENGRLLSTKYQYEQETRAGNYLASPLRIFSDKEMKSSWFGVLNVREFPTVIHRHLGVLYLGGNGGNSLWMYSPMEGFGWFWTSPMHYPYIYLLNSRSWAYYQKESSNPVWFYHYNDKQWISRHPSDTF